MQNRELVEWSVLFRLEDAERKKQARKAQG